MTETAVRATPPDEATDPLLETIQKVLDARAPKEEDPRTLMDAPEEAAPSDEEKNTTDSPAEADSVASDDDAATSDATAAEVEVDGSPASDGDSTDEDYERALTALRRAKVPKSVIENMPKAELLKWGAETAEILGTKDRLIRENAELKRTKVDPTPAPTDSEEDLPEDVRKLVAPIIERGDTEIADAVIGVAKTMQARANKETSVTLSVLGSILANNARQSLVERFPMLKDAANFKKAREKAEKLISTGDYQSDDMQEGYETALADASRILFSGRIEAAARTQQRNGRKSNATSSVSKVPTPRTMTEDQRLMATIRDLAEKKLTPEQARAKYGWN